MVEAEDGAAQLELPEVVVEVNGRQWSVQVPPAGPIQTTMGVEAEWLLGDARPEFRVSLDEEHVELTVTGPGGAHALRPRATHYTLLLLARLWRDDPATAAAERGWVYGPDLTRMLGFAPKTVNLHVFRLRREFAELGMADAADIVQRRPNTGQLRIEVTQVVERPLG